MRKFLETKDKVERAKMLKGYSPEARRNMMFQIRKTAKDCIDWLVLITENMPNVTACPDMEFTRIFDLNILEKWEKTIAPAFRKGLFYTRTKMVSPVQCLMISGELNAKGVHHSPYKLIHNKTYRIRMIGKLEENEHEKLLRRIQNQIVFTFSTSPTSPGNNSA